MPQDHRTKPGHNKVNVVYILMPVSAQMKCHASRITPEDDCLGDGLGPMSSAQPTQEKARYAYHRRGQSKSISLHLSAQYSRGAKRAGKCVEDYSLPEEET